LQHAAACGGGNYGIFHDLSAVRGGEVIYFLLKREIMSSKIVLNNEFIIHHVKTASYTGKVCIVSNYYQTIILYGEKNSFAYPFPACAYSEAE